MTVIELRQALDKLPGHLDITVRCSWEGDEPNGNCFTICGVGVEDDHSTGEDFVALDCDQGIEED